MPSPPTMTAAQVMAQLGHELRTPLNGVLGMAALLQRTQLTAEQRDYVDTIASSGEALLTIVNNLSHLHNPQPTTSAVETGLRLLEEPPASPPAAVDEGLGRRRPLRILLADDQRVNQKVAALLLRRLAYSAELVSDGSAALQALAAGAYDVVLLDLQMPEPDGLHVTRKVRAELPRERQPYLIAMTADATPDAHERCLAAGMDDFLAKPVQLSELAAVLLRAAEQRAVAAPARAAESPASEQAPTIDAAAWQRLCAMADGDAELAGELVADHLANAQLLLEHLRGAISRRDFAAVQRLAHNLGGVAITLGATELAGLCERLQWAARWQSEGDLAHALAALLPSYLAVRKELERRTHSPRAGGGSP